MNRKNITVIRHGRPHAHHKYSMMTMLRGSDIPAFIIDWNTCELSSENEIPKGLIKIASESDYFLCSKLKRAYDSLGLLGVMQFKTTELLNEAELPHGFFKNLKMPFAFWGILMRLAWILGFQTNAESYKDFKIRIRKICAEIELLLDSFNNITVMSHGFVNMQIKRELKRNKWKHTLNCGGYDYWSFDTFEKI